MAKSIMIQGTMSNAGKSLITAALCRIFTQDGYRVAPFKSQNMALNSYITEDGLEMGRAQVVQAEACKKKPSVDMNPILLKPTNDVGSQVIVHGEVRGNMKAAEYFRYKKALIPDIMESFHRLEQENDIIVIEGAGSPAEINLKSEDIVNMGLARMVSSPVLLVGDIDRGGVFAQLYGTVALLEEEERNRIKGMIINKFRGDVKLLEPGLKMMSDKLNPIAEIPFVGVVPYSYVDIEDEDSLTERFEKKSQGLIDLAVIKLPRISNFTDFHVFEHYEHVSLRYVSSVRELGEPDLIILPGTKSTISDLLWLRQNGLESAILKAVSKKTILFGICGGYQMLGDSLSDPYDVEGGGEIEGLHLLPIRTVFSKEKTRRQAEGRLPEVTGLLHILSKKAYEGYEIHMGESFLDGEQIEEKLISNGKNVYGSYLHGLFDANGIADSIIQILCERKGIEYDLSYDDFKECNSDIKCKIECSMTSSNKTNGVEQPNQASLKEKTGKIRIATHFDLATYKEMQYDKLANEVRHALDMNRIYQILEEGL